MILALSILGPPGRDLGKQLSLHHLTCSAYDFDQNRFCELTQRFLSLIALS